MRFPQSICHTLQIGLLLMNEKFISKKRSGGFGLQLPNCSNRVDVLCFQAAGLLQVAGAVEEALSSQHLLEPFRLIEMPLVPALADMAFYGIRIDRAWFPPMLSLIQQRLLLLQVRHLVPDYGFCGRFYDCPSSSTTFV